MKQINFLSKSGSQSMGLRVTTLASTVGSPSAHRRGTMLRLISVLVLVLTFGVGNVWGVAFAPSNFSGQGTSGTGSAISATVDGVTFACDKGYGTTQIRCYSGGKITISSSSTITAISFTFSGSYTGGLETSYTKLSTTSWTKTLSSQARITACTVTVAATYSVVWTINPAGYGTLSKTTGTTTTVTPGSAYTYGSPAYTVTSGSATVSQSTNTFTATPNANCTIRINMVEKPKYTITYDAGSGSCATSTWTQTMAGQSTTLPTATTTCTGWTFAGWCTSAAGSSETNTTSPGDILTGSYTPTSNVTLHAVYTQTEGTPETWNLVSAANDVTAGTYVITWDNSYYLPSETAANSNPAVGSGITQSNSKLTNTVTSAMQWTFTGDNTHGFAISHVSGNNTYKLSASNTAQGISVTAGSTDRKWTASVDGTYGMLLHGDDGGSRYLAVYNNGSWRYYSTGNSYSGTLRLYKKTGGSSTYYMTSLVCCTPLGSINGSVSLTQLTEGVNAGKLQASWPSQANTNGWASPGIVIKIYEDGNNTPVVTSEALANNTTSFPATSFTPKTCTQYYATLTATHGSDASYCAGDLVSNPSAKVTTAGYTYGITKENVSLKAGETEAASTCDGGFMAEYVANTGYALPGTISVSGVSDFDWDGGVLYIEEENVTGNVTTTIAGTCVPPVIGTQPAASASYQQGATPAALSVAATLSSGTLTYLWKVSTDNGDTWSDASGTNNAATYAAANISTANTGTTKYKCIVGNQEGGCSVESSVATIEVTAPSKCLTPTFSVTADTYYEDKSVELACNTNGVTIYYTTDNTTPTTTSSVYSSAISVTQTTTIKAIAMRDGLLASDVAEATYTIKCETPTIVLAAGNYTGVQTTTITKGYGTKIYYTTDGSTPDNTKTEYTEAVSIDQPMTLKAIVWKEGCTNSEVASAAYTLKCTTPTFNYGTGTYTDAQSITLSGTAGADIYYTLDGTDPSKTHGTKYTAAIEVGSNQTVKAIAVKDGWGDSEIASATYTIQYNVYWWVNGTDWNDKGGSTLVTYGQTATAPTTAPTKANGCGDKFMGWTTEQNYENDNTAPMDMFTETSAAITGETNFYAVFADYGEDE